MQLWELARCWYDDRLQLDWRRRTLSARQTLLDNVGLTGEFWDLSLASESQHADQVVISIVRRRMATHCSGCQTWQIGLIAKALYGIATWD